MQRVGTFKVLRKERDFEIEVFRKQNLSQNTSQMLDYTYTAKLREPIEVTLQVEGKNQSVIDRFFKPMFNNIIDNLYPDLTKR